MKINNILVKICFLLILFGVTAINNVQSQSLSGIDLASINVDELSDEQIIDYIKQAEARGLTQDQLEELARQRGVSELQISKLRRRIETIRSSLSVNSINTAKQELRSGVMSTPNNPLGVLFSDSAKEQMSEEERKTFGFDLFRSEKLTFTPNLNIPTPANYVLGPGDELSIDLWGATQQYFTLSVGPEGTIRPPELSPIYVNGLTIEQAERKIIDRLTEIYGGLKKTGDQSQNIFYQVSLSNVRSINVSVVGEVEVPGSYTLNSLSTVFTALYAAGGPTAKGTFRSIKLMRNNLLKTEVDLYRFLIDGIKPNDELLQEGDVIIVQLYTAKVEVEGKVKRPGIYEVKTGETYGDLMNHVGGYTNDAYKSFITVDRNSKNGKEILNLPTSDLKSYTPLDGDMVKVIPSNDRYINRVQLEGAVVIPGNYEWNEGLTVSQLIKKAEGLAGDAYMTRATIYRTNEDFTQTTISFDLQALLNEGTDDINLLNEDRVRIFSIYDLNEEYYVEVNGEVSIPGVLPYMNNMKVEDVILLSGGLKEGASGAQIEISRRNLNGSANSSSEILTLNISKDLKIRDGEGDVILEPFDQIFIRRVPNYRFQQKVRVEGEVTSPGDYAIGRKDDRISDIIERAGGITPYAYPEGAILIRKTEFAEKKEEGSLNMEKLLQLKERILAMDTTSFAVSQAQSKLINRVKSLIPKKLEYSNSGSFDSGVSNRVKKELTEEFFGADSLMTEIELNEEEPTVLELEKILNQKGSEYDLFVREGDVIFIPAKLQTVRVAGEVISPLNLRYQKNFTFKDYINDAGGFTSEAKKGRSYVQYPNGKRRQAKRFLFFKFYPKVEPGSTIFVSRKPDRVPVNLQSIIAITGSMATLALVIDRLSN